MAYKNINIAIDGCIDNHPVILRVNVGVQYYGFDHATIYEDTKPDLETSGFIEYNWRGYTKEENAVISAYLNKHHFTILNKLLELGEA